jgi:hypothetical protein
MANDNHTEQGERGFTGATGAAGAAGAQGMPSGADPVVAYRLGQVEIAVRDGFKAHDRKLTDLTSNFATADDLTASNLRISILERASAKTWLWNTLSAAAGAALALLVAALLIKK